MLREMFHQAIYPVGYPLNRNQYRSGFGNAQFKVDFVPLLPGPTAVLVKYEHTLCLVPPALRLGEEGCSYLAMFYLLVSDRM
jgi:hypothetical protein